MRSALVVFGFPAFEFAGQIPSIVKPSSLVELLRIGLVAALHLAVDLRTSGRNGAGRAAEGGTGARELWSERRSVVGLDLLDRKGEMLPNLVQELDRCLSVVVVVDAQNTKPGRFVDGLELVEPRRK